MNELIYKIIERINKEIGAVPFHSLESRMFIAGLDRAKEIVQRIAKEAEQ